MPAQAGISGRKDTALHHETAAFAGVTEMDRRRDFRRRFSIFADWSLPSALLSNRNRARFSCCLGAGEQTGDGRIIKHANGTRTMMNLKKKLQNPMLLVAQGFVAGAILFYATTPPEAAPAQPQQSGYQVLEKITEA
jgi:hypothetical protein